MLELIEWVKLANKEGGWKQTAVAFSNSEDLTQLKEDYI